nr:hypothetical protein CFP56_12007 [Quercus suber]
MEDLPGSAVQYDGGQQQGTMAADLAQTDVWCPAGPRHDRDATRTESAMIAYWPHGSERALVSRGPRNQGMLQSRIPPHNDMACETAAETESWLQIYKSWLAPEGFCCVERLVV